MRMLVSDMAGRANIQIKGEELGFDLSDRQLAAEITDKVKEAEAAEDTYASRPTPASNLSLPRELGQLPEYFEVHSWRMFTQFHGGGGGRHRVHGPADPPRACRSEWWGRATVRSTRSTTRYATHSGPPTRWSIASS